MLFRFYWWLRLDVLRLYPKSWKGHLHQSIFRATEGDTILVGTKEQIEIAKKEIERIAPEKKLLVEVAFYDDGEHAWMYPYIW